MGWVLTIDPVFAAWRDDPDVLALIEEMRDHTAAERLKHNGKEILWAELGNVAGLLAAALVVFFLSPLQRLAERVASTTMPGTKNTPEYAAFRKMQVYEEAVSEAHLQGGISEKERSLLARLRDSLGISESDAEAIEHALTANQAPTARQASTG